MDEKKEKKPRQGGRQKGTPNRVTGATKDILLEMIQQYQDKGLLFEDFFLLDAKDRLDMFVKILPYLRPKLSSIEHNVGQETRRSIDQQLREMAGEI